MEKNNIFIQNPNKKDRILVFQDKLKRHLSNEYLYLTDKKDDLENQLVQLKVEHSRKNKTLFPNVEQKDVRKYFSPLNIQKIEEDKKDEKDKHLMISIERTQEEIFKIGQRMSEIKEFLHDIDGFSEGLSYSMEEIEDLDSSDEPYNSEDDTDISSIPQKEDNYREIVDYLSEDREVYPQMLRNLYDFSDFLKKEFNQIEVLIEFSDNNIETSEDVNRNLLSQMNYNVNKILEQYDISTILIQGEINAKNIHISLNYICDDEKIGAMNVRYEIIYV